ncbi:MAG: MFS transporter [Actinobacteria bacterium 21-73-9]|nr:MAG: MFS transporter [Actinobacteria bacterium 21-73-9]
MTDAKDPRVRLRNRPGFVRFWMASTVSDFGTYVSAIAIQVIVVFTLHKGAAGVGLVGAARWLPYPLFGLVAGVLVDRSRRRPLLAVTDLVRGLLLVVVPVLAVAHHLSLVVLMLFMAVFGSMSLLNDAASQSFLPRLVPANQLTPANARLDQSGAVAQTSGPAIGGGLVSLLSAPWAVLIDAVSYLVSGLLILRIPIPEPPRRTGSLRGVRREALEGLRWIYKHATLRPLALNTHGWFLCNAVAGTVLPLFVLRTLGVSAFGYGVVLSVGGVGALVGSLAATRLGARFGCGRVVVACRVATAASWASMALSHHQLSGWVVLGAGQLLFGLSMGAENANEMGYWQALTPDALQGRTNATRRSINRAMIVIGAPAGGFLGDAIGYRLMLWIVAGGFLVVAITLGLSKFRNARVEDAFI